MDTIRQQALALAPCISAVRRDLHRHPETAWTEYRTASLVARHLMDLGYTVTMGADAVRADARLDPPPPDICARERQRAVAQGADPALVARMGDGLTGMWADLDCPGPAPDGAAPAGPCVALRFDMDANDVTECANLEHTPAREGFASCRHGIMHACGHDGHTALGMGVAAILAHLRPKLRGRLRLIFQPAEEGGQGGQPMLDAGAVDGVDILVGLHLGIQALRNDEVICGTSDFLATTNFELTFEGVAAHAGMAPHLGRSALLAACAAVQAIHAIPRHGEGGTRVNVGQMQVDGAPNVVPAKAWLAGETRGDTTAIDAYMMEEVERIAAGSAATWGCNWNLRRVGFCPSGNSSPGLAALVKRVAEDMGDFNVITSIKAFRASEDFTCLMNHVQECGGQGTYIQLGAVRPAGHHTDRFDFDESALARGMELLARVTETCMSDSKQ